MAGLVHFLVSGIPAAADGSVQFFQLGETTVSGLVYSDPDGQNVETTHTLDAAGAITRYIGEPCDIVVYDSDGAVVKTVPVIDDAKLVRVNNAIATGTDPAGSGMTIAAGNTTLNALLTLFATSMGADDGFALGNGGETLIKNGLSPFFDLANYGAAGNDTTDDTAAVQAAYTAAAAAGGGIVYVRAGTYKITGAINVSTGIITIGEGAATTSFKQYTSGTNGWFTVTADDCMFFGLTFARNTTSMTGRVIDTTKRTHIAFCKFDGYNGTHLYLNGSSADVRCLSCRFTQTEASGTYSDGTSTSATGKFTNCIFACSIASATGFSGSGTYMLSACEMGITASGGTAFGSSTLVTWAGGSIVSTTTSGTITMSTGTLCITGVRITTGASGTLRLTSGGTISESGCVFGSTDVVVGTPLANSGSYSTTRDVRRKTTTTGGTTYTPDPEYGLQEVSFSGAGMAVQAPSSGGHEGWAMVFFFKNTNVGAQNLTWDNTAFDWSGAALNINASATATATAVKITTAVIGAVSFSWALTAAPVSHAA